MMSQNTMRVLCPDRLHVQWHKKKIYINMLNNKTAKGDVVARDHWRLLSLMV